MASSNPPTKKSNFATEMEGCSAEVISPVIFCPRPSRIETMPMSEATPMETPRMISPLRSLCARMMSQAIQRFSRIRPLPRPLLITQRLDGIQACCLQGRVSAEKHPHGESHSHADADRPDLDG